MISVEDKSSVEHPVYIKRPKLLGRVRYEDGFLNLPKYHCTRKNDSE